MEHLICLPAKIDQVDMVVRAEDRGFDYVGVAEGPLLMSDPWQYMAVASQRTSRVKLGPFVTNPTTNIAPAIANSAATLSGLAPGRVFMGMGAANNALRSMGRPVTRMADLEHGIEVVAGMLRGERVTHDWQGKQTEIEFLADAQQGWYDLGHPVEMWVAAGGPKSLAVAARTADVLVYCLGPDPTFIKVVREQFDAAVRDAGRNPKDVKLCATTWFYETQPGEGLSEAITQGFGSGPLSSCVTNSRFMAQHTDDIGEEIVEVAQRAADAYLGLPPDGSPHHLDVWKRYLRGFDPRHEDIITRELVDFYCLWGDPDQLQEKAAIMAEAGVDIIAPVLSNPMTLARDIDAISSSLVATTRIG
ncbi:MAG: putative methylenetetrahydromethanopterin reductase [Conexibacter sp.]|nr:putative methylenetetrahydromethanopterin reductase [Conexibacter sp.]